MSREKLISFPAGAAPRAVAVAGTRGPPPSEVAASDLPRSAAAVRREALREREVRCVVQVGTCHEYGARAAVEGGSRAGQEPALADPLLTAALTQNDPAARELLTHTMARLREALGEPPSPVPAAAPSPALHA